MEVQVEHLGALQFEIKARQHSVISDQPAENGGFDEGMIPPELLLASLGSCVAYYAAAYLRKQKLAEQGTRVRLTADKIKDERGARLDNFRVYVDAPHGLEPTHMEGIEREAHRCLIHNTLFHPPTMVIEIHAPALAQEEAVTLEK